MTSRERTYEDFDLEVTRTASGLVARVLDSPSGQAEHAFEMPFSDLELQNFVLRVGRTRSGVRRIGSPQYRLARDFGERLYDALFDGEVRISFRRSIDRAHDDGKGLRVRLRFDDVPELAQVPWEFLYAKGVGDFLVLSSNTPLVRHLDLPLGDEVLAIEPPLRVLTVVSSPRDLERLDVAREVELVRNAVADLTARGTIEVTSVQSATLRELRRALRRQDHHVLHFIGHGGYDEQDDDGVLAFEDDEGFSRHISGHQLGTILHDHRSLRLAVLNACEGARASPRDPFAGVAQSLVRRGVPAVVAMQFEVTDDAAIAFSHELYRALVDGAPIEAAVAEARMEIFSSDNDIEWGTPVLYSRARDGRLFDVKDLVAADAPPVLAPAQLPPPPPPDPPAREPAPASSATTVAEDDHADDDGDQHPGDDDEAGTARPAAVAAPVAEPIPGDGAPPARPGAHDAPLAAAPGVAPRVASREDGGSGSADLTASGTGDAGSGRAGSTPTGTGDGGRGARRRAALVGVAGAGLVGLAVLVPNLLDDEPTVAVGGETGGSDEQTAPDGETAAPTSPEPTPTDEATPSPTDDGVDLAAADLVAADLGSVTVDAQPEEYAGVPVVAATAIAAGAPRPGFAAAFHVGWTDEALVVYAEVTDLDLQRPHAAVPSQLWRGDAVHFEVGPDPRALDDTAPLRPTDMHVLVGPGDEFTITGRGTVVVPVSAVNTSSGGVFARDEGRADEVLEAAVRRTDDGYVVEAALAWSALGIDEPAEGDVVGLVLNASDVRPDGRLDAMISTSPRRSGGQTTPGTWTTVELGGAPFVVPTLSPTIEDAGKVAP